MIYCASLALLGQISILVISKYRHSCPRASIKGASSLPLDLESSDGSESMKLAGDVLQLMLLVL